MANLAYYMCFTISLFEWKLKNIYFELQTDENIENL